MVVKLCTSSSALCWELRREELSKLAALKDKSLPVLEVNKIVNSVLTSNLQTEVSSCYS